MEIELKINEIGNLKKLIINNLTMLNEEEFNSVVGDYKKINDSLDELMFAIRNNQISISDAILSLNALIELYNNYNSNIYNNFEMNAKACYAA